MNKCIFLFNTCYVHSLSIIYKSVTCFLSLTSVTLINFSGSDAANLVHHVPAALL